MHRCRNDDVVLPIRSGRLMSRRDRITTFTTCLWYNTSNLEEECADKSRGEDHFERK